MAKPPNSLLRLASQLFSDAAERGSFVEALQTPRPCDPALVWLSDKPDPTPFSSLPRWPWQPDYVDRVPIGERPGQHPWHADGRYYCLEISSVLAACVLSVVQGDPHLVLDLCASPGGKSILAWRRFHPEWLLCNEVIRKRTAALIANLKRCRISPATVVTRDCSRWAEVARAAVDLVIVDAPCSGQSLVARGKPSPGCFHPATINLNANRQRRILAHAAALVAPGGYLAYITCTYAFKENEGNLHWFMKRFPAFAPCSVPILQEFQSHLTGMSGYRFWPQRGIGAGGFAALLRNTAEGEPDALDPRGIVPVWTSAYS